MNNTPSFTFKVGKKMVEHLNKFNPVQPKAVITFTDGTKVNATIINYFKPTTDDCSYTDKINNVGFISKYMVKKYGFDEAIKRKYKLNKS